MNLESDRKDGSEPTKYYKYESYWRRSEADTETVDDRGRRYPWPTERADPKWTQRKLFLEKLRAVERSLEESGSFTESETDAAHKCIFDDSVLSNRLFRYHGIVWAEYLSHYIEHHEVKPSSEFIDRIFMISPTSVSRPLMLEPSTMIDQHGVKYLKITANQLLILDALMEHGGRWKKYTDSDDPKAFRYSEHAGLLDFSQSKLDKIIVSGQTQRTDARDKDIFLPVNIDLARDYEYIFHTHPPTPKPGGRARQGILYEFPSVSDIFHFLDHYEAGVTQGSIIIAAEGLYNIRKQKFDGKPLKVEENSLFSDVRRAMKQIQGKAIEKYGTGFSTNAFHAKIARDLEPIEGLNRVMNKHGIHIDFYPRQKNRSGNWIIETIYLPVIPVEP